MDWIDVYNRVPRFVNSLLFVMTNVIFVGLFLASVWFVYTLVTM